LILQEFLERWLQCPTLEKEGRNGEIIDLISSMIRTTESDKGIDPEDPNRLGDLALQIDCRLPTMQGAVMELAN